MLLTTKKHGLKVVGKAECVPARLVAVVPRCPAEQPLPVFQNRLRIDSRRIFAHEVHHGGVGGDVRVSRQHQRVIHVCAEVGAGDIRANGRQVESMGRGGGGGGGRKLGCSMAIAQPTHAYILLCWDAPKKTALMAVPIAQTGSTGSVRNGRLS